MRQRTETGDAAAQLTLAEMLLDGSKGAPRDPVAAVELLEKSAAQEHRAALLALAEQLLAGKIVAADAPRAALLLERAAELGSPRAAAQLAELHQKGNGVPIDRAKAFELYARAAEGGYVYAMTQAGWLLEKGDGIPADRARALSYYRQAADKKNAWATERLFQVLSGRTATAEEKQEALGWLKAGAQRGVPKLRATASMMLLSGTWEEAELSANALGWLLEYARQRQPGSQRQLGLCLMNGWGMPQDFARANAEFEAAAEEDVGARLILARNLAFGVGVPRDLSRAKALASGHPEGSNSWIERYLEAARDLAQGEPSAPVIFRDKPQFPARLRRAGIEGEAIIDFVVDVDGFVLNPVVISATHPEFANAGRLAVSFWRFAPSAQPRAVRQPVKFTLGEP